MSLKTVSRVINAEPPVSARLQSRVQAAVEYLGYRHNLHASRLRRLDNRTATIGVLVRDVGNTLSSLLYREIQEAAIQQGVLAFAGSSYEDEECESKLLEAFSSHRVDGLIVVATPQDRTSFLRESRAGTALIFVEQTAFDFKSDCVVTDHVDGVRLAVGHLAAHGHQRIGYLAGIGSGILLQHQGYVRELSAHGLCVDEQLMHLGLLDSAAVEAVLAKLMSIQAPPTALFTIGGLVTSSAYSALRSRNLHLQVALVGFDDILSIDLLARGITVVAPKPDAMARTATELLFRRIEGDESLPVHQRVPCQLIARGTGEIGISTTS